MPAKHNIIRTTLYSLITILIIAGGIAIFCFTQESQDKEINILAGLEDFSTPIWFNDRDFLPHEEQHRDEQYPAETTSLADLYNTLYKLEQEHHRLSQEEVQNKLQQLYANATDGFLTIKALPLHISPTSDYNPNAQSLALRVRAQKLMISPSGNNQLFGMYLGSPNLQTQTHYDAKLQTTVIREEGMLFYAIPLIGHTPLSQFINEDSYPAFYEFLIENISYEEALEIEESGQVFLVGNIMSSPKGHLLHDDYKFKVATQNSPLEQDIHNCAFFLQIRKIILCNQRQQKIIKTIYFSL